MSRPGSANIDPAAQPVPPLSEAASEAGTSRRFPLPVTGIATFAAIRPCYLGSKPRFLLPAMLLGLPLARLLARARSGC